MSAFYFSSFVKKLYLHTYIHTYIYIYIYIYIYRYRYIKYINSLLNGKSFFFFENLIVSFICLITAFSGFSHHSWLCLFVAVSCHMTNDTVTRRPRWDRYNETNMTEPDETAMRQPWDSWDTYETAMRQPWCYKRGDTLTVRDSHHSRDDTAMRQPCCYSWWYSHI